MRGTRRCRAGRGLGATWIPAMPAAILALAIGPAAAGPDYGFYASCTYPADAVPLGTELHEVYIPLRSTGEMDDLIEVTFDVELPAGWTAVYCQVSTGICYVDDAVLSLAAGQEDMIRVDYYPHPSEPGHGSVFLEFRSTGAPQIGDDCTSTLYVGEPLPDVGQEIDCPPHFEFVEGPGGLAEYFVPIQRTGEDDDFLVVKLDHEELPEDWFAQFCLVSSGICYTDSATFHFPPGGMDSLKVDAYTGMDPAVGELRLQAYSQSVPAYGARCYFRVYDRVTADAKEPAAAGALDLRVEPNPVFTTAQIAFRSARPGHVRAEIYSASGRRVRTLADGPTGAGWGRLEWDGRDARGRRMPAGLYLVRLTTPRESARAKILLAR